MTERTINLVLTQTECNQLANLLDVAVKAGGIQIAKGALYFIQKMEAELNKPEIVPTPPEVIGKATVDMKDEKGNPVEITGENITIKGKDSPQ